MAQLLTYSHPGRCTWRSCKHAHSVSGAPSSSIRPGKSIPRSPWLYQHKAQTVTLGHAHMHTVLPRHMPHGLTIAAEATGVPAHDAGSLLGSEQAASNQQRPANERCSTPVDARASQAPLGLSACGLHDFLPDGLPDAVRNAAMLPTSALARDLQWRQHQQQQRQLGHFSTMQSPPPTQQSQQVPATCSTSSLSADPIVAPPQPGSYGAVGSVTPHLAVSSGCWHRHNTSHPPAHPHQYSCTTAHAQFVGPVHMSPPAAHPMCNSAHPAGAAPATASMPAASVVPADDPMHLSSTQALMPSCDGSSKTTAAATGDDPCTSSGSNEDNRPSEAPCSSSSNSGTPPTPIAASNNSSSSGSSRRLQPLITYIETIMMQHLQQQLSSAELSAEAGGACDVLKQKVRQLMTADSLQTYQELYLWLNHQLHGLQIRTVIGPKVIDYTKGVAYLDPRTPANIYHKDPSIEQFSAIHAPSSPPAPAPVAAATAGGPPAGLQQISCEQYLLQTYGPLQHLELPCVAVKLSATACQDAELREQFIHYPLELCSVLLAESGEAKRGHACEPWPQQVIDALASESNSPPCTAAVPWWIAESLNSRHWQTQAAAAAATAAAAAAQLQPLAVSRPAQPAAGSSKEPGMTAAPPDAQATQAAPAPAQPQQPVSAAVCCAAKVQTGSHTSTPLARSYSSTATANHHCHAPMPAMGGSTPAGAAPSPLSTPAVGHASAPSTAPVGIWVAAQSVAADSIAETGNQQSAGGGSGDVGTGAGCSSTPSRSGLPSTSVAPEGGSGGLNPPGCTDEASSIGAEGYMPLSQVARAFLKMTYPESTVVWELLHCDDLQCTRHQQAYVELHRHLTGMQVRVEFGGNQRHTRDLKHGIAFLDPRPPAQILHKNHSSIPVQSPDGCSSQPDIISVQNFLTGKYGVELQHPEWPCVGYKLGAEACQNAAELEDCFITYPMEVCSVILKADGTPRRGRGCPWDPVPLDALSTPDNRTTAAAVPGWIAAHLNQRYRQDMQHAAAAADLPDSTGHSTHQDPQWNVCLYGQQTSNITAATPPAAASAAQPATAHADTIAAAGSSTVQCSADCGQVIGTASAAGLPQTAAAAAPVASLSQATTNRATAPAEQHLSAVNTAAGLGSSVDASSPASPLITMDPRSLGMLMASLYNNLQMTGYISSLAPHGTSVTSTSQCPSAAASTATDSQRQPHQQPQSQVVLHDHAQGPLAPSSSSTAIAGHSVGGYSRSSVDAGVGSGSSNRGRHRQKPVSSGFTALLGALLPLEKEKKDMGAVLNAVCTVIQHKIDEMHKLEWQVAEVIKAGSFAKGTSLRGSSDLDVVVKLICHTAPFRQCRKKFLAAVTHHLCRPIGSAGKPPDSPDCGWVMKECHVRWFAKLEHPVLRLQLDIQVAQHFGTKEQTLQKTLIGDLLETAEQRVAGSAAAWASSDLNGKQHGGAASSSMGSGSAAQEHTGSLVTTAAAAAAAGHMATRREVFSDRQRVTDNAAAMNDVVKGVDTRMYMQFKVRGMGRLCTDIIRMMKAWSKHGLPKALAAAAAAAAASATAAASSTRPAAPKTVADSFKGPPGYIWEIVVVSVLEEGLRQGKKYNQGKPLDLFLDVLQTASKLRSSMNKSEAIVVTCFYTRAQALMSVFQVEWGPEAPLYAPFIICPVDPTYNCTENAAFRDWDALADAAGQLQEHLKSAMLLADGWQWLCDNSTLGPVAADFKPD